MCHLGLVVPLASAASSAGGCLPTFDVDVSGVSCALGGHGRQSMVEIRVQGATRLHRVTVMIFISIAATLQRLPGPLAVQARAKVQIDVDSATACDVSSDGDRSVLWNIGDFHRLR